MNNIITDSNKNLKNLIITIIVSECCKPFVKLFEWSISMLKIKPTLGEKYFTLVYNLFAEQDINHLYVS